MGLLDDIISGRSSDIYGQGLLTPEQRGGLGNIGLLALAGKLGQLAGPSFSPVPDFGAALGQAAGAYGASQEGAGTAALNAILTGQKGRKLEQELDYYKQLGPVLSKLAGKWPGADGGAGGGEGSGSTGGGAAAPPGAGGGGGGNFSGGASEAANLVGNYESEGLAKKLGISPYNIAYGGKDLSNAPRDENGFPQWEGKDNSHAAGRYQFQPGTWARYAKPLGITDFSPASQDRVFEAAYADRGFGHWAPYNPALASAIKSGAGAPAAAAPVGAGTSGFLAPTAPNPLSDAEPMVGIPRPVMDWSKPNPAAAGPPLPGGPGPGRRYAPRPETDGIGVSGAAPVLGRPGASPEDTANQILRGWTAGAGGGGPLAAPPGAGTDSYVTPQGPAGDVGPAGPAGPATPRAPLPTMGPAGIELPPMQGPLAAPAPAAAAPAAPGPGLLSPPGAAPAAALPRVNPAYDAYLRNLGLAGALAKGAGLPDVFGPLTGALKDSPAYAAQLEIARKSAGLPFIGPETAAAEEARSKFVGPNAAATAAAQDPYIRGQAQAKSDLDLRNDLLKQGVVRNADGSLRQATEAELAALTAKDRNTPTTEMKDYAGYVKDQQMRNLAALSYFDWSLANKKAGAASTVLNTTEGFEAAQTRARIAIDTKLAETIGDQALTGKRLAPLLDEVIRLANQTPEGMAGPIAVTTARAFSSLGIPVSDRMSNAELLNTITQRLVPIVREPGATSQGELNTYLQASPGLMQSAAGRIKIAEMTKALIARTDEIAKVYRNNLGAPDLHDKLSALDKPLFTDDQRAAMNAVIGGTRSAPATGATPTAPPGSIATPYGTITPVQ